ncbi:MAG: hypothetical protein AAFX44_08360 [Pseudomonadota bacterium]
MKLILLPGMDGTGDMFAPFLSVLPETIKPIVVSYPADQELGYDELTDIAREAIPDSGIYSVLGESLSGPIAITLASEADSRLSALFLCCSFVRNPSMALAAIKPILPVSPVKGALADFAAQYLLGADSCEQRNAVRDSLNKVRAEVIRKRAREVIDIDVTTDLESVSAPILYLQAAQDRLVPIGCAQYIREVAPSAEILRIDGPHLLLQTEPEHSRDAVVGFLQRSGAI